MKHIKRKTKRKWNEDSAIRSAIRRVFSRSPVVMEVLNGGRRTKPRYKKDGTRHKVDAVEFQCQVCLNWVGRNFIEVDHKIPVVDIQTGFIDLNTYKKRLFCSKENLQRICDACHQKKSNAENLIRRTLKDTAVLDELEIKLKTKSNIDIKALKKELSKYTIKKKPEVIKNRALMLKEMLLKKI
jgi:5-methylcytosine-specific restriction endonuclease McrA